MRILCSAGCVYYSSCYNFKTLLFLTSQLSHSPWCQERLLVHPTKRSDLLLFLSLLKMFKHTVTLQPVDRLLHHHASQYGTSPTRCLSVLWSLKKKKEERKKKKKKKLHFQKRKSHSAEQIWRFIFLWIHNLGFADLFCLLHWWVELAGPLCAVTAALSSSSSLSLSSL